MCSSDLRRWKLIDTAPELIHIKLAVEIAWEKQQKHDTGDRDLQIPILLRDGEACRWCGIPVQPNDNRSRRGRTFDHLRPGMAAGGPDGMVVACRGCNGKRGKDWNPDVDTADSFAARWEHQLRPPPRQLFFVRSTVTWLESEGHQVPAGSVIAERAPSARDTPSTTQTPGPAGQHPAPAGVAAPARRTTAPGDQHPATQAGVAAPESRSTTSTTSATHPATAGVAAHPGTGQHPAPAGVAATPDSTTAPECQHPATQAGVAAPESRTDPSPTDRSGTAPPGRVGVGPGRVGSPTPPPAPAHPPDPPQSPATTSTPRRTRRGRRGPRPVPPPTAGPDPRSTR